MTTRSLDAGIVATDESLVSFYVRAFGLTEMEPRQVSSGVVHRLQVGDGVLKILLRSSPPTIRDPRPPRMSEAGISYLTFWVDDHAAAADRCRRLGATFHLEPKELRPGVHTMLISDPEGNTIEVMQDSTDQAADS